MNAPPRRLLNCLKDDDNYSSEEPRGRGWVQWVVSISHSATGCPLLHRGKIVLVLNIFFLKEEFQ